MAVRKVFDTENEVGYNVTYTTGNAAPAIAHQDRGGVCLSMVLTWIKESNLALAAGRTMADVRGEITGGYAMHVLGIRHHSLRARMRIGRNKGFNDDQMNEIRADYLASFTLRERPAPMEPTDLLSTLPTHLALMDEGYWVMLLVKADDGTSHAVGFKVTVDGLCYFLDPNSGLYEYDDFFDMGTHVATYINVNYAQRGYAGGSFAAQRLALG